MSQHGDKIAKVIATFGSHSRRDAEKLVLAGKVQVNHSIICNPAIRVKTQDVIHVNDVLLEKNKKTRLWLYHKPKGLITTYKDPYNRVSVFDQLPDHLPRLISVGRLDINSEGLLLLTNDGMLAQEMCLSKNRLERIYKVRAYGNISAMNTKQKTVVFEGVHYNIEYIKLIRKQNNIAWFLISICEGKNREIRNIFRYFGLQVTRLIRIQYGKYKLNDIQPGECIEYFL